MIRKFNEYISEGLWKTGIERSKTGELRKESGVKVETSLGTDLIIQNLDSKYEDAIKYILDGYYGTLEPLGSRLTYKDEDIKKIKDGTHKYVYLLKNHNNNEEFVIHFYKYDLVKKHMDERWSLSEDDYYSICKSIVDVFDKKNIDLHWFRENPISENSIIKLYEGKIDFSIWKLFIENINKNFKGVRIKVDDNDKDNVVVGLVINYKNISQYEEIMKFTQDWFNNNMVTYSVSEGLWKSGIERSRTGVERRENKRVKVKTDLGIDIELENPSMDYDKIMETLITCGVCQIIRSDDLFRRISPEAKKMIMDGTHECSYLVKHPNPHVVPLVAVFDTYEDTCDWNDDVRDNCSKCDYISICRCLAECIRKIEFEYTSKDNNGNDDYNAVLIGGYDVRKWFDKILEMENIDEDDNSAHDIFLEEILNFRNDFHDNFKHKQRMFIWSYSDQFGKTIALDLTYDTIKNYEEYKQFTKHWFRLK